MLESELAAKAAVAELEAAQRALGATPRTDPEARKIAAARVETALLAQQKAKEAVKTELARRNFAGMGNNPFYLVCVERFDASTIAELEVRALAMQTERERFAAERRAKKETAALSSIPSSNPNKSEPEVIVRRKAER
jgi:hypothetical protein